jgi:hypothetical protein
MAYLYQLVAAVSVQLQSLKALNKFHYGHFRKRRVSQRSRQQERDSAERATDNIFTN